MHGQWGDMMDQEMLSPCFSLFAMLLNALRKSLLVSMAYCSNLSKILTKDDIYIMIKDNYFLSLSLLFSQAPSVLYLTLAGFFLAYRYSFELDYLY